MSQTLIWGTLWLEHTDRHRTLRPTLSLVMSGMQHRASLAPPVINQPNKMHHLGPSSTRMINKFEVWSRTSVRTLPVFEHVQAVRATCGFHTVECIVRCSQTAEALFRFLSFGCMRCCWAIPKTLNSFAYLEHQLMPKHRMQIELYQRRFS